MDPIDKGIILELARDCRASYQQLANQFKITVNAIKKRVNRLVGLGVIQRFLIYLSLAMIDAEALLAIISTDGSQDQEVFIEKVAANPMVFGAGNLSDGSTLVYAEYVGSTGLAELDQFLHGLEGVVDVEMHTIMADHGIKRDLTLSDLKVLRCLREEPRMPISEISQRSRLTPRRVRTTINQFLGGGGSLPEMFLIQRKRAEIQGSTACVHFSIYWDPNAGGQTAFMTRINWEETKGRPYEIVDWLKDKFPNEYWYSFASASQPTLFSVFVVDHMREARRITQSMRDAPNVEYIETLITYPIKSFPGLREGKLEEMLARLAPSH